MGIKDEYPHQMAVRINYKQRDKLFEMAQADHRTVQSYLRNFIDTEYTRFKRRQKSTDNVIDIANGEVRQNGRH